MAQRSPKRRHTTYLDIAILEWLRTRGAELDRTVDWQIREILRAAMDAEQRQRGDPELAAAS